MGYFKDRYIEELEREYARLVDSGVMHDRAYAQAGENTYHRMREILTSPLDRADSEREARVFAQDTRDEP